MNCKIRLTLAFLCLAGAGVALATAAHVPDATTRIERGRYLVEAGGCADCHSPKRMGERGPEPDESLALSGHRQAFAVPAAPAPVGPWIVATTGELTAWNGPWGTSFARNLTPDVETGLGSWSEEEFVATFRTGRTRGRGRELLPPMPLPALSHLTDEDLRSIYAYLKTLKPISNRVPEPQPPTVR